MRSSGELATRRQQLRVRSARLRAELAGDAAALGERFRLADELIAASRSGLARVTLVAGAIWLLFGRRARLIRLGARAVALWPLLRPLLPHLVRVLRRR
jgi:hypothetical protein